MTHMINAPSTDDIAVVLGTSQEIGNLAGIVKALGSRARVVHTGQHWNRDLAAQIIEQIGEETSGIQLTGMAGKVRGEQIAAGIMDLAHHFSEFPPALVLVQGDTMSSSAGAQAASYSGLPVVHAQAGNSSSNERTMSEDINGRIVTALSQIHCVATEEGVAELRSKGVAPESIVVTGSNATEANTASVALDGGWEAPPESGISADFNHPETADSKHAGRTRGASSAYSDGRTNQRIAQICRDLADGASHRTSGDKEAR